MALTGNGEEKKNPLTNELRPANPTKDSKSQNLWFIEACEYGTSDCLKNASKNLTLSTQFVALMSSIEIKNWRSIAMVSKKAVLKMGRTLGIIRTRTECERKIDPHVRSYMFQRHRYSQGKSGQVRKVSTGPSNKKLFRNICNMA